jgi:predicted branched-subunit amino acid permease
MRPHFLRPSETPATTADPPIARQVAGMAGSIIPVGIVFGAAAANAGLEAWETVAFSTFVFAGASQMLAVEGLGAGAPLVTAIVAGLLVKLRLIAFGLSVAPVLEGRSGAG